MKHSTVAAHAACAALALLALAAGPASADTLKKIEETGRFALGYRESSIPFSYVATAGKPVGFGQDIAQAVVQEVRRRTAARAIDVEYVAVTSANRIPLLQNGTIDLECGSTTNNTARSKEVAFALNYFYSGTRLLVKKSSGIGNYSDLAGKTVASTSGTTNAQVLRRYNQEKQLGMQILLAKDHADAMLLVQTDRAAAFAMDDILLYGLIPGARQPSDWQVVGDTLQVEPYACMLRKDDPAFKALVDGVIASMMRSGEFERLYRKWFVSPIPPRGINLNVPMSPQLRDNLSQPSDKPEV
ncbi:MAG TPA: amino acid ABC transporter substrate-binding protein [Ramlibacter sp.]|uniref:amino acid ABC transporter substrate-binding protein n=1 Tax=Ramlibacter sp. TaxID=1917967 RepID=UPI002BDC52AF|nr:amino acid ABC transporter substrate-binding protein [Ramlibacter sp.]HVZ44810.1 amino acid ABC transporter substrate-binding protein [Ramlibacter sp.]